MHCFKVVRPSHLIFNMQGEFYHCPHFLKRRKLKLRDSHKASGDSDTGSLASESIALRPQR